MINENQVGEILSRRQRNESISQIVGALNLIARLGDPFFAPGQDKDVIRKHLRQKYEEYCRLKGEQPKEEAPPRKPVKRAKSKKTDS